MIDVDAACCDIRGHQHRDGASAESCNRVVALCLRFVAVQGDGDHSSVTHLPRNPVAAKFGPHKDDGAPFPRRNAGGQLIFDVRRNVQHYVTHGRGAVIASRHVMAHGVGH